MQTGSRDAITVNITLGVRALAIKLITNGLVLYAYILYYSCRAHEVSINNIIHKSLVDLVVSDGFLRWFNDTSNSS